MRGNKRISPLTIGPVGIEPTYVEFKCEVNYQTDASNEFYGGNVSSEEFRMSVEYISSVTCSSHGTIVEGGSFNLACSAYGPPKSTATFALTNDKNKLDSSKYSIIDKSTENGSISDESHYFRNYTVKTAAVELSGDDFFCTVSIDLGSGLILHHNFISTNKRYNFLVSNCQY